MRRVGLVLLLMTSPVDADAGSCGGGQVIALVEGGWGSEDLFLKLDNSEAANEHAGTEYQGWVRYKRERVGAAKLGALRWLALASNRSAQPVWVEADTGRCDDATGMRIWVH